jgi:hypothetical protein
MSLGFLCESALLPSKAKKIEVDGRSQLRKCMSTRQTDRQSRPLSPALHCTHAPRPTAA